MRLIPIFALAETTAAAEAMSLSQGLSAIGDFFTSLWTWVAGMGEAIVSHWVLLLFVVGMPVAGFLVSFVKGLINRRK